MMSKLSMTFLLTLHRQLNYKALALSEMRDHQFEDLRAMS